VFLQIGMAAVLRARASRGTFARALSERFVSWFSVTNTAPLTGMKDTGFLDARMTVPSPPNVPDLAPRAPMPTADFRTPTADWWRRSINANLVAA
jgi:hypothetical protein